MKLLAALVKVYKRPGQLMPDFAEEIKALSDDDRNDFVTHFNKLSPTEAESLGIVLPVER